MINVLYEYMTHPLAMHNLMNTFKIYQESIETNPKICFYGLLDLFSYSYRHMDKKLWYTQPREMMLSLQHHNHNFYAC